MRLEKIYVVFGEKGEYEYYSQWYIIGYISEKLAKEHVEKANKRADEIKKFSDEFKEKSRLMYYEEREKEIEKISNIYDNQKQSCFSAGDSHYYYIPIIISKNIKTFDKKE